MKAAAKFLFRLVLYPVATYGVLVGLPMVVAVVWGVPRDREVRMIAVAIIVGGSLLQAFLSLLLGGWHILSVRRRGFPLTDKTLAVRQERTLTLDLPYDATFRLCLEAIRALERTEILEDTDYAAGEILVRKLAWWGAVQQKIRIRLRRQENRTNIVVKSGPPWPWALADFGYSLRIVDGIVVFLLGYSSEDLHGWMGDAFQDSRRTTSISAQFAMRTATTATMRKRMPAPIKP